MRWTSLLNQWLLACSAILFLFPATAQEEFVRMISLEAGTDQSIASRELSDFQTKALAIVPYSGPYPPSISLLVNGSKILVELDGHSPRPTYFVSLPQPAENLEVDLARGFDLFLINSGSTPQVEPRIVESATGCPSLPAAVTQEDWRDGLPTPSFNRVTNNVTHHIVHHTAGSNTNTNYTQVVRDIYLFHTQVNGWSDIGYNFVVAQDGTLYEGRDPGTNLTEFEVVGAHFCGKNSGTLGIAMLGNFETAEPDPTALQRLEELLAFSLDQLDIDPEGQSSHRGDLISHVSGHRDGCTTLCPGANLYFALPNLRSNIKAVISDCPDPELPAPQPTLSFEGPVRATTRSTLAFVNTSIGYDDSFWTFEGGSLATATDSTVEVYYQRAGLFDIALVGQNETSSDTLRAPNYLLIESNQALPLIYPNPVYAGTVLDIELADPIITVELLSISGQEVAFFLGVDGPILVPPNLKGIYLVDIRTQNDQHVRKILVQ